MKTDPGSDNETPEQSISHDSLANEAARISNLVLTIHQKLQELKPTQTALFLIEWADNLVKSGQKDEAEFLYLSAINVCLQESKQHHPQVFTELRAFALSLTSHKETVIKLIQEPVETASIELTAA